MKLIKALSVSLIALAAGSASAGEFYTYPSGSKLINSGASQGDATAVVKSGYGAYNGTAVEFFGNYYSEITAPADSFLKFFCVEFQNAQIPGNLPYSMSTSAAVWPTLAVYDNLRKLYDLYYPNKSAGDFWNSTTNSATNFGTFASNNSAAAFQLAVWEIVFDNGNLNLFDSSSAFYATSSDTNRTLGQSYLAGVVGYGSGTGYQNWTLYQFTNAGAQDYVTATYHVPEPGSLAIVGLALAGLGFVSRRRI